MAAIMFWLFASFSWAAWWFTAMPPNRDLLIGITLALMAPGLWRMRHRAIDPVTDVASSDDS